MPQVSVIITSYNVSTYIATAVESALSQNDTHLEVIVVDDASTDDSWGVIARLSDPRVRAIRLEKNQGPGAARNAGMALARGEWLAVLDGDDQFLPNRLARCLALARERSADIVVDNILVHREASGANLPMFSCARWAALRQLTLPDFLRERFGYSRYTLGYLKPIFRRAFLLKHGLIYRTDLPIGEDFILMAEALACGAHCAVEPGVGYCYTARAGSASHRLSLQNLERMMRVDEDFALRYALHTKAMHALSVRRRRHREYHAYLRLVASLKAWDMRAMAAALWTHPLAARHLWQPLCKRLLRAE